jgi:hypothetical protein
MILGHWDLTGAGARSFAVGLKIDQTQQFGIVRGFFMIHYTFRDAPIIVWRVRRVIGKSIPHVARGISQPAYGGIFEGSAR